MAPMHILPKSAKIRVADLKVRDIEELHQSMKDSPYQANRVRSLLSKDDECRQKLGMAR